MSTTKSHAQEPAREEPHHLDESHFIRERLFDRDKSAFRKYHELVFHRFTWWRLIRYELLSLFVTPLPGALGFALRKRLLRSLFNKAGKGTLFGASLTLRHADRISLGDDVILDSGCLLDARGAGDEGIVIGHRVIVNRGAAIQAKVGGIDIGADCNIGADVQIISQGPIIIEENVSVAGRAIIAGGRYVVEHDGKDPAKRRTTRGAIRIGRNARIGMGAIVQDGVAIGENAIVAPGAVVFEDVATDTVVWGNPARPVRRRSAGGAGRPPGTAGEKTDAVTGGADAAEAKKRVCQYLENDLFIEFGPGGYGSADSLLDAGVMDSLALVRLLLWIEETFGVDLDFANLDPADIDSVDKIVARLDAHR